MIMVPLIAMHTSIVGSRYDFSPSATLVAARLWTKSIISQSCQLQLFAHSIIGFAHAGSSSSCGPGCGVLLIFAGAEVQKL